MGTGDYVGIAVMVLTVIGIVILVSRSAATGRADREAEDAQILNSAQSEFAAFALAATDGQLPSLNQQVGGFILKPAENCIAIAHQVALLIPHKETTYVGGSHGVSIHIAKGVNYRVGAFRGRPISNTTEAVGDVGNLYITSQRVVFAGQSKVTSIAIDKVADARCSEDRVVVVQENKPPLIFKLGQKYRGPLIVAATHLMVQKAAERKAAK